VRSVLDWLAEAPPTPDSDGAYDEIRLAACTREKRCRREESELTNPTNQFLSSLVHTINQSSAEVLVHLQKSEPPGSAGSTNQSGQVYVVFYSVRPRVYPSMRRARRIVY
jgi:hypothetical protein